MPENTNIIFFDEYKKLDKLCSEMYGKNSGGVTCYLNDMMAVPVMQETGFRNGIRHMTGLEN